MFLQPQGGAACWLNVELGVDLHSNLTMFQLSGDGNVFSSPPDFHTWTEKHYSKHADTEDSLILPSKRLSDLVLI